MERTLKAITSKISSLHEAAFWLALFSVLSQFLAFLRDHLLASYFGASQSLDIYYTSFRIPDFIFVTLGSLVSISVLVPMFSKKALSNSDRVKSYLDSIFTSFSFLVITSCALAFIFMPNLAKLLFRGFDFEVTKQIILFSRILLLSPILLGLSNFFGSIVQYEKRFLLYSLSPFFYNLGIIFGTVFGANHFGIMGVVLGVVFGALLHFLVPLSYVFFTDSLPRITLNINFAEVKETAIISIPRALALSFNQIINIIFTIIASLFGVGAISVFNLAWNLQSVPLSVVGVSYSLAAFPTLSEHYAKKNIIECGRYIGESLRYIIFLVLPISALFIILRSHVIRVVLGSGAFDWSDTRLTSAVIALFALSFVFQSVQLFLTRAHYALGNTKTPLLIDMFGVVITVGAVALLYFGFFGQIILWFEWFLEIDNIAGAKIIILPIAFSIGEIYTAFTLWFRLDKETRLLAKDGLFKSFIQTLSASLIVMLVTFLALRVFDRFFVLNSFLGVLGHALVAGSLGIIGGIIFLILIKNSEMATVIAKLKSQ